ncbi:hypothetical protein BDV12DRAFT_175799 [Aspergillus spectabilis]
MTSTLAVVRSCPSLMALLKSRPFPGPHQVELEYDPSKGSQRWISRPRHTISRAPTRRC